MIYHEICFLLTLIFKYNFVKTLLLMFISIPISFENKSQVFERSDCTITVHNDLCYNDKKYKLD